MAKTEFANLVLNVRLDSKQRALQEAVLVPWRQLAGERGGIRGMAHLRIVGSRHR